MVYSNINKNGSVYAVLLLLSLALISESLPTADLSDKEGNDNSGRWSSPRKNIVEKNNHTINPFIKFSYRVI